MRTVCPVCDSPDVEDFLLRRDVPVHQNLLFRSPDSARGITRGDLVMAICHGCEFVFNRAFDAGVLLYGADYENDQTASPAFDAYVKSLVRMLVDEKGIRDRNVVEIGCGNGYFLRELASASDNRGTGFDPSYRGPATDLDGRLTFVREFFSASTVTSVPDVIVSRHVIEHVEDPARLVDGIAAAIGSANGVTLFLETPCLEWILRNQVIWDFFYEHCSLFTSRSLASLVSRAGFTVKNVSHVFGGQYLWLEAVAGRTDSASTCADSGLISLARAFGAAECKLRETWSEKVQSLGTDGRLAIWGAGAKGVTFAGLVDPEATLVDCMIDLNPQKQGKYAPGTAHPIVDVHAAARRGVRHAILMNPNYYSESAGILQQAGIDIELVL